MIGLYEQKKLKDIFNYYELNTFQHIHNNISTKLNINLKILRY